MPSPFVPVLGQYDTPDCDPQHCVFGQAFVPENIETPEDWRPPVRSTLSLQLTVVTFRQPRYIDSQPSCET